MSSIYVPDLVHSDNITIKNGCVYDLYESVAASRFPMQVDPTLRVAEITPTAVKLAQTHLGEGHDNWLMGVRVAFDITMTAKMLIEAERYHFFDIVSCSSTMHRIARFDLDKSYCGYVDPRMVAVMKELVCRYNEDPSPEGYLRVLYSNPAGFLYTLRVTTNYRQLKTIYTQRRNHKLPEWREFCRWIENLPESQIITGHIATKEES